MELRGTYQSNLSMDYQKILKANEYMKLAQEKIHPYWIRYYCCCYWIWGNPSWQYDDATNLTLKAANIFVLLKNWSEASNAYITAAKYSVTSLHPMAADLYFKAAHCQQKYSSQDSLFSLNSALTMYKDEGKYSNVAKVLQQMAQIYESEGELGQSILNYEKALNVYESEYCFKNAIESAVKVAELYVIIGNFKQASKGFRKLISICEKIKQLDYVKNGFMVDYIYCLMAAGERKEAKRELKIYSQKPYSLFSIRELFILQEMINAMKNADLERFVDEIKRSESFEPLNTGRVRLLEVIKKIIQYQHQMQIPSPNDKSDNQLSVSGFLQKY